MNTPSDKHPFCYESRDLMRERLYRQQQRRLTTTLTLILAILCIALWAVIRFT